jgi:hypothetical protein
MMRTLLAFLLPLIATAASAQPATTTVPTTLLRSPCRADQLILGDLSCGDVDAIFHTAGSLSTLQVIGIVLFGWVLLQLTAWLASDGRSSIALLLGDRGGHGRGEGDADGPPPDVVASVDFNQGNPTDFASLEALLSGLLANQQTERGETP